MVRHLVGIVAIVMAPVYLMARVLKQTPRNVKGLRHEALHITRNDR